MFVAVVENFSWACVIFWPLLVNMGANEVPSRRTRILNYVALSAFFLAFSWIKLSLSVQRSTVRALESEVHDLRGRVKELETKQVQR